MRYFSKFPSISYTMKEIVEGKESAISRTIPNMTVYLQMSILNNTSDAYDTYIVKDRDRPDTVAVQIYGASQYAWVIMLANNMKDWCEWPLDDGEFYRFINKKYESSAGANDGVEVAHNTVDRYVWTLPDGQTLSVDQTMYFTLPYPERSIVTVYEREYSDNDIRRTIRIPPLSQLDSIIRQFEKAVAK